MFHTVPEGLLARMRQLEAIDARDRSDGTPKNLRLRQVEPDTGRFIALLAASAPEGAYLEIGTSGGYSGMWLALACRQAGRRLTTFEVDADKVALAAETFRLAGVSDVIEQVHGDAREHVGSYRNVGFCFLDAEKDVYEACYDQLVPNLVPGGWIAADNVISHAAELEGFIQKVLADPRVDALIVPVGKGVLVARAVGGGAP